MAFTNDRMQVAALRLRDRWARLQVVNRKPNPVTRNEARARLHTE
jgi:hypothetical protein